MSKMHEVKQGECLASIAALYGFAKWEEIYEHEENNDFRNTRTNPHILHPGDLVVIPEVAIKTVEGSTDMLHRFVVNRPQVHLRLRLQEPDGRAITNRKYKLVIDGRTYSGNTDGQGELEQFISSTTEEGDLQLWHQNEDAEPTIFFPLLIGHLDPVEELSGVQARLKNLGFACAETGINDEQTEKAVKAFQRKHNLPVTGVIDDTIRQKLKEQHEM